MPLKRVRGICISCLLSLIVPHVAATETQDIRRFESGSYQAILDEHEGQPFVMVLWSLDCVHCQAELKLLGDFTRQHAQFNLVLISTDSYDDLEEIRPVIEEHGLARTPLWVFSVPASQRLRFEIDPHWYGELPRNYLFDARHVRRGKSGPLSPAELMEAMPAKNNSSGPGGF